MPGSGLNDGNVDIAVPLMNAGRHRDTGRPAAYDYDRMGFDVARGGCVAGHASNLLSLFAARE